MCYTRVCSVEKRALEMSAKMKFDQAEAIEWLTFVSAKCEKNSGGEDRIPPYAMGYLEAKLVNLAALSPTVRKDLIGDLKFFRARSVAA